MNDVLLSDEDMEMMYLSASAFYRQQKQQRAQPNKRSGQHHHHHHRDHPHHAGTAGGAGAGSVLAAGGSVDKERALAKAGGGVKDGSQDHEEVEMMFENYLMQVR